MMRSLFILVSLVTSALAFAECTYEAESKSLTLARSGEDLKEESIIRGEIQSPLFRVCRSTVLELDWVNVPVINCRVDLGDGRGDWKGFYNSPSHLKATALAAAIKGVGEKTAPALVKYFEGRKKPRTWQEFSAIIYAADKKMGNGLATNVLVTYGSDNMVNLGYYSEQDCAVSYEQQQQFVLKEKVDRAFYQNKVAPFEIRLQNSPLLAGESERFTATYNGIELRVTPESQYNNYALTSKQSFRAERGEGQLFEFSGTIIPRHPPATSNASIGINAEGKITFTVYNPALATDKKTGARSVVQVILKQERFGPDLEVAKTSVYADEESQTFNFVVFTPVPGKSYYLEFRTSKINSPFYRGGYASSARETGKITR